MVSSIMESLIWRKRGKMREGKRGLRNKEEEEEKKEKEYLCLLIDYRPCPFSFPSRTSRRVCGYAGMAWQYISTILRTRTVISYPDGEIHSKKNMLPAAT